jgi:hypothetical protein
LKNRESELFQKSKRDNREDGLSKLDSVRTDRDYIVMNLEMPALKR